MFEAKGNPEKLDCRHHEEREHDGEGHWPQSERIDVDAGHQYY